jgi:four helix bundle protein
MSNLAEGFERANRSEFHQYIVIAKASCAEVRSQLYVALDAGYLTESQFSHLTQLAHEVARLLGGLRSSVQRQRDEQRKP